MATNTNHKKKEGEIMKLTIEEASKISGMTQQYIRIGLQKNIFDFGYAFKMKGKERYKYFIIPYKFLKLFGRLDLLEKYEKEMS